MCVDRMTNICRDNAGEVNEPECGHAFAWRSRRKNWRGPARAKCRNRSFSDGTAISRPLLAAAAIKIRCGIVKYSIRCHMYPTQTFDDRALAVDWPPPSHPSPRTLTQQADDGPRGGRDWKSGG